MAIPTPPCHDGCLRKLHCARYVEHWPGRVGEHITPDKDGHCDDYVPMNLSRELHAMLMSLSKLTGEVKEEQSVKEAAMTMVLVKAFDTVSPAHRQQLVQTLEKYKDVTGKEQPDLVQIQ